MDPHTLLSITIIIGIILIIIFEAVKHYVNHSIQLWSNAYDSLKEQNSEMKSKIEELQGCMDFQYSEHAKYSEELEIKLKKLQIQIQEQKKIS
tara:strand:- start:104 stop:382 length:279 start_codon:yes stop_codon:yes gene_type:complete